MAAIEMNRRTFVVSAAAFAGGMSLSFLLTPTRAQAASMPPGAEALGCTHHLVMDCIETPPQQLRD